MVIVVYRVENIAVGYIIRLVTREQLLEVVLVVYREENIAVGHMIRLATLEQLLWLVILGWKDSPDDAMILVVDTYKNEQFFNRMRLITTEVWWILALWWRKAFGTRST